MKIYPRFLKRGIYETQMKKKNLYKGNTILLWYSNQNFNNYDLLLCVFLLEREREREGHNNVESRIYSSDELRYQLPLK